MEGTLSQWFQGAGAEAASVPVALLLPRLLAALVIGVLVALRPWRLLTGKPLPRPEMVQAQLLLCAAAAIITIVIGDSVAKAFGLVGLGSFVRFRSGLKDPRDAAILFLLIGLGMACGHGAIAMALAGAVFVSVLLAALDLFKGSEPIEEEPKHAALAQPATGALGQALPPLASGAVNHAIPVPATGALTERP